MLQCCEIIWTIQNRIFCQRVVSCSVVTNGLALLTEVILLKGKARESETGRPSDERWLPSTSAGIRRFYHLITLQSSTGALRAVNYFAKQRGDVPRRTVQQSAEWNKDADTKLKSARAGMEKRLSNGGRWEKWREKMKRRWPEGVSGRRVKYNISFEIPYSRR